ncbi:MAG: outer membrane protein assembly factor BamA [Syntrophales bacterium]|nr:outer membrane protein assembly factor BamA [Syntrophales bacterium]
MNKKVFISRHVLFLLTLFLFSISQKVFAEDVKKIALFPFDIYSKANATNLRKAIHAGIAAELQKLKFIQLIESEIILKTIEGKRINEKLAITVGKDTGATFVIMGSLSEFGEMISVDARIIDIRQEKALSPIFVQGKGLANIGHIATQLKTEIMIRIAAEQRIARIEFKGNRKIEASAISQVLKSAKGNFFSEADLSSDIKAIYRMGYFQDVTADVIATPEGKVITFILEEKALITEVKIKGNKAIGREEIEAVLTTKARQSLNPEKIKADAEKIKALYDNKGYYNAEVRDVIERGDDRAVRVIFNVTENKRLYIKRITIEGNQAYTDKELRKMIKISEWSIFRFLTDSGLLKKEQLKQDINKLQVFYLNNGFINVQVGEPEITHDKKWIYVKIPITEGKRFRVGKVDITGDEPKLSRAELLKNMKINKREYFDRASIMKDIEYLAQVCNDEGYAYADVTPRTIPDEKEQTVDVIYHITKGSEVSFNRITITGNTKTRDKVIRRQLAVVEGDLYSSSKLKRSYMALNRLRYFEEVNFQTEKGPDETLTDVNIHVKEKPTGFFSVGAGYSAVDQAVITGQISQQNLFGRGQSLSLKAHLGSRVTSYDVSFIEPWLFDIPLWSKFDLWNLTREYDSYDLDSSGFGITFGYPLWEYVTGYIGYRLSTNTISNLDPWISFLIQAQEGSRTTSSITMTLLRDTTDDYIFPSRGSKNSISLEHAGTILQGDTSFTKYGVNSTWFFPLFREVVFGIRGRGGYVQGHEGKDIPVYERFYLGGINSLRGLREVGPKDPWTGDVIGGTTMFNVNAEFLFPLIKSAGMKGVVFFDTGNAWESGYHLGDLRKTAGAGIRWYSPIGPLRLEWGYVLDRKDKEPPSRWEFTIGMFM